MERKTETQTLIPLQQAVEAATGTRPHLSTIIRWITKGARGIKLNAVFLGGRRMTTIDNVQRFIELSSATESKPSNELVVPKDRTNAVNQAKARFQKRLGSNTRSSAK